MISFSAYLDHFFVIYSVKDLLSSVLQHEHLTLLPVVHLLIFCGLALPATIVLATATYHWVEKPGIALGKKLIMFLNTPRALATALPSATTLGILRETERV